MPHGIIMTIIIGFIIGVIAKMIMPGRDPAGFIATTLIGIAGSFLGTFIGRSIGHYNRTESAGWLMSILGALVLLAIYHLMNRNRARF
jgi:uncharacterized membrane protein YeaQ/YmgE (transglycosylase-associated protein family)